MFREQIKGLIGVLILSETKLDDKFPEANFLIERIHSTFRFDRIKMVEELCFTFGKIFQLNYEAMIFILWKVFL